MNKIENNNTINNKFFYKKFTISFIIKVTGALLALFLNIFIARKLKVENFGIYTFALSSFFILLLLSKLGIDVATTKYVAFLKNKSNLGALKGFIKKAIFTTTMSSFSFAVLSLVVLFFFKNFFTDTKFYALLIFILILPLSANQDFFSSYFRGQNKIVLSELPESIIKPLIIIFCLFVFFINDKNLDIIKLLYFVIIASIFTLILTIIIFYKQLPNNFNTSNMIKFDNLLSKSVPLLFSTGVFIIILQTDVIMLGIIKDNNSVALYAPANKIASFNNFIISILIVFTSPLISEFHANKDYVKLNKIIKKTVITNLIVFLIFFLLLFFFGKNILNLYGQFYIKSYYALIILCCGYFFRSITVAQEFMIMTRFQKESGVIILLVFLINIVFNYYLINKFGVNGAALATSFSLIIMNIVMTIYVYYKTSINVSIFSVIDLK